MGKQEITAMRIEWKRTCTDKCNLCREEQEGLIEVVHKKREGQLRGIRLHWNNQIRRYQIIHKKKQDLIIRRRKIEIEKIYAKKKMCPKIVANEETICRAKVTLKMEKVRHHSDDQIELVKEHSEEHR